MEPKRKPRVEVVKDSRKKLRIFDEELDSEEYGNYGEEFGESEITYEDDW